MGYILSHDGIFHSNAEYWYFDSFRVPCIPMLQIFIVKHSAFYQDSLTTEYQFLNARRVYIEWLQSCILLRLLGLVSASDCAIQSSGSRKVNNWIITVSICFNISCNVTVSALTTGAEFVTLIFMKPCVSQSQQRKLLPKHKYNILLEIHVFNSNDWFEEDFKCLCTYPPQENQSLQFSCVRYWLFDLRI